ncbi:MAG: hypothetical protein BMS9Abin34_127 [Patescibacteria group bacterium]|nr:MAG: hypothetical protein BMS9Abin34_127 [Patescibacteria group bacterium]
MIDEVGLQYPKRGDRVRAAQKKDYQSGIFTEGAVRFDKKAPTAVGIRCDCERGD